MTCNGILSWTVSLSVSSILSPDLWACIVNMILTSNHLAPPLHSHNSDNLVNLGLDFNIINRLGWFHDLKAIITSFCPRGKLPQICYSISRLHFTLLLITFLDISNVRQGNRFPIKICWYEISLNSVPEMVIFWPDLKKDQKYHNMTNIPLWTIKMVEISLQGPLLVSFDLIVTRSQYLVWRHSWLGSPGQNYKWQTKVSAILLTSLWG